MENKINIARFKEGSRTAEVKGIWQWDYGQILRIQGLNLPAAVEIHFSLDEHGGEAVRRIGVTKDGVTDVVVPDTMLENESAYGDSYYFFAYIYLTDETSGNTEYKIRAKVSTRSKPEGYLSGGNDTFAAILKTVNEIADDKVTRPLIAKVGQVLSVKATDESGKPTEFEATDQGGGVSDEKIAEAVGAYMEANPIEETDPTVSDWAKQPKKPTYTASEVGALPDTTKIPSKTSDLQNDSKFTTLELDETLTDNTKAAPAGMVGGMKKEISSLSEDLADITEQLSEPITVTVSLDGISYDRGITGRGNEKTSPTIGLYTIYRMEYEKPIDVDTITVSGIGVNSGNVLPLIVYLDSERHVVGKDNAEGFVPTTEPAPVEGYTSIIPEGTSIICVNYGYKTSTGVWTNALCTYEKEDIRYTFPTFSFSDESEIQRKATITFIDDDGYADSSLVFKKALDDNGLKGCIAIVTDNVGTTGRYSVEELNALKAEGFEILSHSATHSAYYKGASLNMDNYSDLLSDIERSYIFMVVNGFTDNVIVYPYGGQKNNNPTNKAIRKLCNKYYAYGVDISGGVMSDDVLNNMGLKRLLATGVGDETQYTSNYSSIISAIDECIEKNGWLIIGTHSHYQIDYNHMKSVSDYVKAKVDNDELVVKTFSDAIDTFKNRCSIGDFYDSEKMYISGRTIYN